MIEHSVKKCGISNNLDGTDNDIMFEDVCPMHAATVSDADDLDSDTYICGMTPPCCSWYSLTKVILKDFNYDMI